MARLTGKLIKRYGSKAMLVKQLVPMLRPHECYVEVFGGSLAVFLAKPRAKVNVINDIDQQLVTLFNVVKYHPQALRDEMAFMLNSRVQFTAHRDQPGVTDVQRAARFLHCNRLSFSGDNRSYGIAKKAGCYGGNLTNWQSIQEVVQDLSHHLNGVAIECLLWQRIIKSYDREGGLFFLDPPYVDGNPSGYEPFTPEAMQALADAVRSLKADWLVTVGDTPAMRAMWSFGDQCTLTRKKGGKQTSEDFHELVIRKRL